MREYREIAPENDPWIQKLTFTKKKKKKISLSLSERAKKKSHWIWKSLTVFVQVGFFLSQKSGARIIPIVIIIIIIEYTDLLNAQSVNDAHKLILLNRWKRSTSFSTPANFTRK